MDFEIELSQLIVFLSIAIIMIWLDRGTYSTVYSYLFGIIVLLESTSLFLFYSSKFSSILSFLLIVFSSSFVIRNQTELPVQEYSNNFFLKSLILRYEPYFSLIGLFMIFLAIASEILFLDSRFSNYSYFLVLSGFYMIIFEHIEQQYNRNFILFFLCLLMIFIYLPMFLYKLDFGFSRFSVFWYSSPNMVEFFLSRPLSNFLILLGYNVHYSGDILFYEDTTRGLTSQVQIGEACSGLHSITLMFLALVSHIFVFYRKIDYKVVSIFLLGTLIGYISNLLRMSIIILAGHYYGPDALLWTHKNVGIILFIMWFYLFYGIVNNLLIDNQRNIYSK